MTQTEHQPVLLDAALSALAIAPAGRYVDATYGRGGHSRAILEALGPAGRLIGLDQDPSAADDAAQRFGGDTRFQFVPASFGELATRLAPLGVAGSIDGLLFDLGVSSPQLDTPERGFSFREPGPLDMRMNPAAGATLGEWLGRAELADIRAVLRRYGEDPFAARVARAIVQAREAGGLTDTRALADVIRAAVPARIAAGMRIHPATRAFQAFRIHVNDELAVLRVALDAALDVLAPGGRLVVISFHSLEDRIVKRFIRAQARPEPPPVPMAPAAEPALRQIGKPVTAGGYEQAANPRARSAIMRVAERTAAPRVTSGAAP